MGSSDSKPDQEELYHHNYNPDTLCKLIDSFGCAELDNTQFVSYLFIELEKNHHPFIGRVAVANTYIMQRFFLLLTKVHYFLAQIIENKPNGTVNCSKFKEKIRKLYSDPEKAIEYSFALIDLDHDSRITKAEFVSFIDNSFTGLFEAAKRQISDKTFCLNFENWIKENKNIFLEKILEVFSKNAHSHPEEWLMGDFKRWIRNKKHWSLDIEIGANKLRVPLNLLCLFAIELG